MIYVSWEDNEDEYLDDCATKEEAMRRAVEYSDTDNLPHYVYVDGELVAIAKDGALFEKRLTETAP